MRRATILYDADCGFCRWSLAKLLAWDRRRALRPVPLQDAEAEMLLTGMSEERRMASWHLVTPDGSVRSAGAAVEPLARMLPGGRPLASLARAFPGATERGYDFVVRHRGLLGRSVGRRPAARARARIEARAKGSQAPPFRGYAQGVRSVSQEVTMTDTEQIEGKGIEAVSRYLDGQGVDYETVEHEQTFTAAAEAKAAGVAPDHAAKTMVLRDGEEYRLAVIPAAERLDLRKVREVLDASPHLRLATEGEMADDFKAFEVGALPPLGPMLPAPEVVDRRLMEHDRILCTGGDHQHSVLIDPEDLVRVTEAKIGHVCDEGER